MKQTLLMAAVAAAILAGPASAAGDYAWVKFGDGVVNWAVQPGASFTWHNTYVYNGDDYKDWSWGLWNFDRNESRNGGLASGEYKQYNSLGHIQPMPTGDYLLFDLGEPRLVSQITILFWREGSGHMGWDGMPVKSLSVLLGWDDGDGGITWATSPVVTPATTPTFYPAADGYKCTCGVENCPYARQGMWYEIAPVTAQYVKIADLVGSNNGSWRISEVLITNGPVDGSSAVPEPATMTLLALGGLALLRRR